MNLKIKMFLYYCLTSIFFLSTSLNGECRQSYGETARIELIQVGIQLDSHIKKKMNKGISYIRNFYCETGRLNSNYRIKIRIFGNVREYKHYMSSISTSSSTNGFYSLSKKEVVINGDKSATKMLKTIYHESSHAFMRSFAYKVPAWVDEGLAEYFEEVEPLNNHVIINIQKWRDKRLKLLYRKNNLMSIYDSVNRSGREWNKLSSENNQDVRNISWSLFYYLMGSSSGKKRIIDMVANLNPKKPYLSKVILQSLSPLSNLSTLENNWLKFILTNKKHI